MKKELLFAIIAGGLLGLIIAFGIWRVNLSVKNPQPQNGSETTIESPTPSTNQAAITLANWEDYDVSLKDSATLTGLTEPNSLMVISTSEDDFLIKTDAAGKFSQEVELTGGTNEILLTVFVSQNKISKTINLVYSSEFSKVLDQENGSESTDATSAAEQKIKVAAEKPVAYTGTVTDLTDSTIQLKGANDEIFMINTEKETTYVKTTNTTSTIKAEDIAIGDYIIALGFKNEKAVLSAKRVISSSQPEALGKKVSQGAVTDITATTLDFTSFGETNPLTISLKSSPTVNIFEEEKLTKSKISEIEVEDNLIIVTTEKDDLISATSIFIIK